jgi:hypothetical protein
MAGKQPRRVLKAFLWEGTDMKIIRPAVVVLTLVLFGAVVAPKVRAQDDNFYLKRTVVTFSQQIEIPGRFLPAGTYTMELAESNSYRHIVRFLNQDRTRVVATVLAIPNARLETTNKTVLMFEERPINSPEALKAWFYPGDGWGHEFVYPKRRAIELAKETKEPVLAFAQEPEPVTVEELATAPVIAETPTAEEVQLAEAVEIPVLVAQAQQAPKTGSMIPLIGMMGMASLGLAFAVKRLARESS